MASLTLLRGEEDGEAFALDTPETTIGREEGCTIHIEGLGISRRHCSIARVEDRYLLRDLDSENGTWVNGQRVREQELRDGDLVGLGVQASLSFRNQAQAVPLPTTTAAPAAHPPSDVRTDEALSEVQDAPRAARWLLFLVFVGLAILIGMMIDFCLRS
jgi:pSer/pThr/pTyr-binding forkhead associated (FHA) protein